MSRIEVLQTVTVLINGSGALAPSLITLKNGSRNEALPVGLQMNAPGAVQLVLHDPVASKNRSIAVGDVVGIR